MIDINTPRMKEYEIETHDSYVNCIDINEIMEFYERYIHWLDNKLESKAFQNINDKSSSPKLKPKNMVFESVEDENGFI